MLKVALQMNSHLSKIGKWLVKRCNEENIIPYNENHTVITQNIERASLTTHFDDNNHIKHIVSLINLNHSINIDHDLYETKATTSISTRLV